MPVPYRPGCWRAATVIRTDLKASPCAAVVGPQGIYTNSNDTQIDVRVLGIHSPGTAASRARSRKSRRKGENLSKIKAGSRNKQSQKLSGCSPSPVPLLPHTPQGRGTFLWLQTSPTPDIAALRFLQDWHTWFVMPRDQGTKSLDFWKQGMPSQLGNIN